MTSVPPSFAEEKQIRKPNELADAEMAPGNAQIGERKEKQVEENVNRNTIYPKNLDIFNMEWRNNKKTAPILESDSLIQPPAYISTNTSIYQNLLTRGIRLKFSPINETGYLYFDRTDFINDNELGPTAQLGPAYNFTKKEWVVVNAHTGKFKERPELIEYVNNDIRLKRGEMGDIFVFTDVDYRTWVYYNEKLVLRTKALSNNFGRGHRFLEIGVQNQYILVSQVELFTKMAVFKPEVNTITELDDKITGRSVPDAKIAVVILDTEQPGFVGYADRNGDFSISIPRQKAGTVLQVSRIFENGSWGEARQVTVKETETVPSAPQVSEVKDTDEKVTGTTKPGSTVTVKVGTEGLGKVTADAEGKFSIVIPKK
ncbi:Ig-like domain-containing protein, partial [Bacillus thuringiensis]|nr:Ig-like domain-containing protein [Bacillus thuringiensis]